MSCVTGAPEPPRRHQASSPRQSLPRTLGALPTGWYVQPNDPDDLRDAVNYLLAHPAIADEIGANARRVVEGCFGLDAFVERFAALLRG